MLLLLFFARDNLKNAKKSDFSQKKWDESFVPFLRGVRFNRLEKSFYLYL